MKGRPLKKLIGYVRVSTKLQGDSGLGLAAQRATIAAFARTHGVVIVRLYEEIESGRSKRPKLQEAIRHCERTGAALVVSRLDRLGRRAAELLRIRDSEIDVRVCDMPALDAFTFGVLAMVAEKEGDDIRARTKAALAAAKERGQVLGCPIGAAHLLPYGNIAAVAKVKAQADQRAERLRAELDDLRSSGVRSVRNIAEAFNERGIVTPRGGAWHPTSVARLIERLAV